MPEKYTNIAAIVLAAGSSSRMGRPKALLKLNGDNFINRILNILAGFHLKEIVLLLGKHAEEINRSLINTVSVRKIVNPDPELGPLSSIKLGLRQMDPDVQGMLLVLVDHPLVETTTYLQILEMAAARPDRIILPNYDGRNGHPVYFGRRFFRELNRAPLDQGARYVVRKFWSYVLTIPVRDEGILKDVDDPAAYRKYIKGTGK